MTVGGQERIPFAYRLRRGAYGALPHALRDSIYSARHPGVHPLHSDRAEGDIRHRVAAHLIRSISGDDRARCSSVSPHDQGESNELLALTLEASHLASRLDMSPLLERLNDETLLAMVNRWPGEYFKLLAAIVEIRGARRVVEIGTHRGLGALSLGSCAPTARPAVTTFDITPYSRFPGFVIRDDDHRIQQFCGDLSDSSVFSKYESYLREADIIFIDGPKDGVFEKRLLTMLLALKIPDQHCLLIMDDIRLLTMRNIWGELALPKFDATSLGHWSGTGLAIL